jgi:hypothetical protein
MYIAAGRNRLYAKQGRADANDFAEQARALFKADAEFAAEYNHTIANGKWNHMMDQTHIGYTYWQEPPLNAMPAVTEVQPAPDARMGVAVEGSADVLGPKRLSFDNFVRQTRSIQVFNRGTMSFHFEATASEPWIVLSSAGGEVSKETQVDVSVDWGRAPVGKGEGEITLTQQNGSTVKVHVEAFHPDTPSRESLDGFVESDGYVSIEAEHSSHATGAGDVHWDRIPEYGATLSGMSVFPVTAQSVASSQNRATLEYRMYLFESGSYDVQAILGPTLNFVPGRGLRFAVWFDDDSPQIVDALEHNSDGDWAKAVSDGVRRVEIKLNVKQPGYHTLRIGMVDPGIVLEKLVVSSGNLEPSYLEPPESFRGNPAQTK